MYVTTTPGCLRLCRVMSQYKVVKARELGKHRVALSHAVPKSRAQIFNLRSVVV